MQPFYVICSYVTPVSAFLIIVTNLIELWCIRKLQKSKINPLVNFIRHLSLSDLMVGTMIAGTRISAAVEQNFKDNNIAVEVKMFFRTCSLRFSLCASVFIMTTFAVTKMVTVKQGYRITQSTSSKVCIASWLTSLLVVLPEYGLFRLQLIPRTHEKYRALLYPIVTFIVCIIFIFSYCTIYRVLRDNTEILAKYIKKNSCQKMAFEERATTSDNSVIRIHKYDTHSSTIPESTEMKIPPAFRIGFQRTDSDNPVDEIEKKDNNIHMSRKQLTKETFDNNGGLDVDTDRYRHRTLVRNRRKTMRRENKRKLIKMAVLSLAAYMICWIPYSVTSLLRALTILQNWNHGKTVSHFFANIAFWNSIVNPVIFFVVYFQRIKRLDLLRW